MVGAAGLKLSVSDLTRADANAAQTPGRSGAVYICSAVSVNRQNRGRRVCNSRPLIMFSVSRCRHRKIITTVCEDQSWRLCSVLSNSCHVTLLVHRLYNSGGGKISSRPLISWTIKINPLSTSSCSACCRSRGGEAEQTLTAPKLCSSCG